MDLNDLATFIRVAERGSFSGAARSLGVPTSTVSRAIARLEESLSVRLLQRTTRKVSLTREGAFLRERSEGALESLSGAAKALRDLQEAPRGVLRITAPQDLGPTLVAEIVHRYVTRYPEVRVEVELSGRIVDLVGEGFDVAIRAGRLRDSSLVARKLGDLCAWLVASPSYVQANGLPRSPAELERHQHVLFRASEGEALLRLRRRGAGVKVRARGPISGDDFGFVRGAVLAGAGIGLLPSIHCDEAIREGRMVRVLPDFDAGGGALYLVYPTARHLPAKVAAFRELAIEVFAR
ncbi:MAG: LysR family transcriptional regulator [Myxococcales bacterium]|nr:LysR family transcriptional regulator [Myxococcales bacterium]